MWGLLRLAPIIFIMVSQLLHILLHSIFDMYLLHVYCMNTCNFSCSVGCHVEDSEVDSKRDGGRFKETAHQ